MQMYPHLLRVWALGEMSEQGAIRPWESFVQRHFDDPASQDFDCTMFEFPLLAKTPLCPNFLHDLHVGLSTPCGSREEDSGVDDFVCRASDDAKLCRR
jgi:hypothetical protein